MASEITRATGDIEVVGEGQTVAGGDLVDFVLAVAVECRPLDLRLVV